MLSWLRDISGELRPKSFKTQLGSQHPLTFINENIFIFISLLTLAGKQSWKTLKMLSYPFGLAAPRCSHWQRCVAWFLMDPSSVPFISILQSEHVKTGSRPQTCSHSWNCFQTMRNRGKHFTHGRPSHGSSSQKIASNGPLAHSDRWLEAQEKQQEKVFSSTHPPPSHTPWCQAPK